MTERAELYYFLQLQFGDRDDAGAYQIIASTKKYRPSPNEYVVVSRPYIEGEDLGEYAWPADVRAIYEKLTGKTEFSEWARKPFNIVPAMLADDDEISYDCPCAWAQRVEGHAVYCENDGWLYAPRKCRRGPGSWDGNPLQETCPGFKPRRTS